MNTATQQPEALRLAQLLESFQEATASVEQRAAAALRRLHTEVQQLRADLEAVGAGGVGPLIPTTVQHQGESSGDNELQRKTGDLITTAAPPQSGGIPPDWKPVPMEPTDEMLQAFKRRYKEGDFWRARITGAVCAMLAAAPQPPGGQEPDWQDLYRKEKRRAEMWIAKYEKDIGKLQVAVPVAEQPQGEQEPVAEVIESHVRAGLNGQFTAVVAGRERLSVGAELFVHPQPRQPLTDEQWLKLWTGKTGQRLKPGLDRDRLLRRFRFAERAHGIGGKA